MIKLVVTGNCILGFRCIWKEASLHWLPVRFRIESKILLLTYKALNDRAPSYLKDLSFINLTWWRCPGLYLLGALRWHLLWFGALWIKLNWIPNWVLCICSHDRYSTLTGPQHSQRTFNRVRKHQAGPEHCGSTSTRCGWCESTRPTLLRSNRLNGLEETASVWMKFFRTSEDVVWM